MEAVNETTWLLLVVSLPTDSATARMRIWRALKALGCGAMRDGAYLLPDRAPLQQQLRELADETVREGGSAWLLSVQAQSADECAAYRGLFERATDYAHWLARLVSARATLSGLVPADLNRLVRKLRREFDAIAAIDYFPTEAQSRAEAAWRDFMHVADTIVSPGEPQAVEAPVQQRAVADYQGRVWATRRLLWVDRVASAWLIKRFIDRSARFVWLATPADCPPDALGFDFDGAAFTHIGARVSFEVLLSSFGLEHDHALMRLGALVHALDVGGSYVPEASGVEAMLAGLRQQVPDDDQLLADMGIVLDALHAHFSNQPSTASKT